MDSGGEARPQPDGHGPLLRVRTLYLEPGVEDHPRGREILARFPDAQRIVVPSHWNIPGLHGNEGLVRDWVRIKRDVLVLGVRKTLSCRFNGRSADWIAPSTANGCAMACAYCYVPRHKGYANPITVFVNIEQILGYLERHALRQGPKPAPDQVDPRLWVYDIGENSDLSVDALVSDNVRDLVALFRRLPNAKASFATKYVNRELLGYDPQGRTRIRFSLMPQAAARVVDVRTSPMHERIEAINEFVEAGYEVHLNFSPVIVYEGWRADYAALFREIDAALSERARRQIAAEVIFLTHNEDLHRVNLGWHPKAEELLWTPRLQETKRSEQGGLNLRYRAGLKGRMVAIFRELLEQHLPGCPIRYAF
ncbi:spore photoproduct lyase family protein [Caldimonas tepidiphila]|uniref:spore photoproduct lyase family protein n=1 Tax=Caldimonas tepidiphila TaxID=2315841 RepID=UPI000E5AA507|nr:spore photoproduct lyase family protein [Caldimonas tepidiphila]